MWVGHILDLLNLHPAIQEHIESLPPGTPERYVTERLLRPLTKLPPVEQIKAFSCRLRDPAKEAG